MSLFYTDSFGLLAQGVVILVLENCVMKIKTKVHKNLWYYCDRKRSKLVYPTITIFVRFKSAPTRKVRSSFCIVLKTVEEDRASSC